MFDWFRDMAKEMAGIDSEAAKKELLEKKAIEKSNRYIFTKKAKTLVIALAVIYIFMSGSTIALLKDVDGTLLLILKNIVMSILAIFIILSLIVGKKKGELAAVIGIFVFVVCLFLSVVLI